MNHALTQVQPSDRRGPARLPDAQYRELCRNMGWEPQPLDSLSCQTSREPQSLERTEFTALKD